MVVLTLAAVPLVLAFSRISSCFFVVLAKSLAGSVVNKLSSTLEQTTFAAQPSLICHRARVPQMTSVDPILRVLINNN